MDKDIESLDIAVCHGNSLVTGGDYKVAEEIARTFDAPLYIGFMGNNIGISEDIEVIELFDSNFADFVSKSNLLMQLFNISWWEHSEELQQYDIIIQSGNEPGWYVPEDGQTIVKYCHAPPRTPYENFQHGEDSFIRRNYSRVVRSLYLPSTKYPTKYIVPSELVKKRVRKYWDIESNVVYPPIKNNNYKWKKDREDYYLSFSRLTPDKRIYQVAQQFENTDKKLVIGGEGKQERKIEKIANKNKNIHYEGFLSEDEKIKRLSECKALIFNPINEAFGIVPAEAMASGAPVIGVKDGYTKYQIKDGFNGTLFERGNLIEGGIKEFEKNGISMSTKELVDYAEKYSSENFREKMLSLVKRAYEEDSIKMEY